MTPVEYKFSYSVVEERIEVAVLAVVDHRSDASDLHIQRACAKNHIS